MKITNILIIIQRNKNKTDCWQVPQVDYQRMLPYGTHLMPEQPHDTRLSPRPSEAGGSRLTASPHASQLQPGKGQGKPPCVRDLINSAIERNLCDPAQSQAPQERSKPDILYLFPPLYY